MQESYRQIMKMRPKDLKKRLMVKFRGEEGLDYGGVARWDADLLTHSLRGLRRDCTKVFTERRRLPPSFCARLGTVRASNAASASSLSAGMPESASIVPVRMPIRMPVTLAARLLLGSEDRASTHSPFLLRNDGTGTTKGWWEQGRGPRFSRAGTPGPGRSRGRHICVKGIFLNEILVKIIYGNNFFLMGYVIMKSIYFLFYLLAMLFLLFQLFILIDIFVSQIDQIQIPIDFMTYSHRHRWTGWPVTVVRVWFNTPISLFSSINISRPSIIIFVTLHNVFLPLFFGSSTGGIISTSYFS